MDKAVDVGSLQPIYTELTDLIGEQAMLDCFDYYHGMQLVLPLHLYDRKKARRWQNC